MEHATERFDTVIVGGGQAGLAVGYHLTRQGHECAILDAGERVGDPWRKRWDSLHLYTPARYDALPGMPFPSSRHAFPTAHEMGDYLEAYAARFELPVRAEVRVDELAKSGERYVLTAGDRRFEADQVVVATGVMQKPVTPAFAAELSPEIRQLHSNDYRNPSQLQEGPVLVVGASHSGADIAYEVANAHETILSGRDTGQLPFSIESRRARVLAPVLKLLATRVLTMSTPIGRKIRPEIRSPGGPLLRFRSDDLRSAGIERVLAKTVGVAGGMPVLEGGRVVEVSNVIWCTGFRSDYDWINVPVVFGKDGFPEQDRGVVPSSPGLYFVGMLFLHSFSSMLILGAGRDAGRVAKHVLSRAGDARLGELAGSGSPAAQEIAA